MNVSFYTCVHLYIMDVQINDFDNILAMFHLAETFHEMYHVVCFLTINLVFPLFHL